MTKQLPLSRAGYYTYAVFILIITFGMVLSTFVYDAPYGSLKMIQVLLPFQIALIGVCAFSIKHYFSWKEVVVKNLDQKSLAWLLPLALIVATVWIIFLSDLSSLSVGSSAWNNFLFIGLVTLLVGISEELMFRGILLHSLLHSRGPRVAIIISASLFSLLHSINIMGNHSLTNTLLQMVTTFILGVYAAGITLKVRNLVPMILFHWLWDFILVGSDYLHYSLPGWMMIAILIEFVLGVVIWMKLKHNVIGPKGITNS